eukprot:11064959-Ditylum_brightwellii.AAC.1
MLMVCAGKFSTNVNGRDIVIEPLHGINSNINKQKITAPGQIVKDSVKDATSFIHYHKKWQMQRLSQLLTKKGNHQYSPLSAPPICPHKQY